MLNNLTDCEDGDGGASQGKGPRGGAGFSSPEAALGGLASAGSRFGAGPEWKVLTAV
uniref:Uncharacterized protein n=1 Tax=Podarcis muralis TaxID=64176 RepID=A0A670IRA8_PODMU